SCAPLRSPCSARDTARKTVLEPPPAAPFATESCAPPLPSSLPHRVRPRARVEIRAFPLLCQCAGKHRLADHRGLGDSGARGAARDAARGETGGFRNQRRREIPGCESGRSGDPKGTRSDAAAVWLSVRRTFKRDG